MKKLVILLAAMLMGAMVLEAAPRKVPTAALKALKSSKNKKAIRTGMVFMDGKFIPAPYTVERYGTALRINGVQVTGPMIAWDEFLKTQEGAKVVTNTTEIPGEAAGAEPEEPEETYEEDDDDEDPLAALFDDEPKPAKPKAKKAAKKKKAPAGPRQVTTTKVEFNGEFTLNPAAKKLLGRIDDRRTKVDLQLRKGGFYFFGSKYAGTNGDSSIAQRLLKVLPEAMSKAASGEQLYVEMRQKGMTFLTPDICEDLFANRADYVKLIELRKKLEADSQFNQLIGR